MSKEPAAPLLKNLPPELAGQIKLTPEGNPKLTPKELRRDEAYRDKLMGYSQSAARLSAEEERLAHAHVRLRNYQAEASRLHGVLSAKRLAKGVRAQTKKSLKVTGENLAEALFDCGLYWEALSTIIVYSPKSHLRRLAGDVIDAIERPDDEHCPCPATDKHESRRIYVPERGRFVPLIKCKCGHLNASEAPTADYAALQIAKVNSASAKDGGSDDYVLAHADRLLNQ